MTGSEDGMLRVWPLDFSVVFMEAGESATVGMEFEYLALSSRSTYYACAVCTSSRPHPS